MRRICVYNRMDSLENYYKKDKLRLTARLINMGLSERNRLSVFGLHFFLIFFLLTVSVARGQESYFVGLRQVENCTDPVDSAMLWRQNELYTGNRGTLFKSWTENPLAYTPMLEAAWQYCVNKVPGEKRLYVDGRKLFDYAIQKSRTEEDSAKYFKKLISVYDLRKSNIDKVNAHARRQEDRTSLGALEMLKIRELMNYKKLTPGQDAAFDELLYEKYLPVIEEMAASMDEGEAVGSDVNPKDLEFFFLTSINHYVRTINNMSNDSVLKERATKADLEAASEIKKLKEAYEDYKNSLQISKPANQSDAEAMREYKRKIELRDSANAATAEKIKQVNERKRNFQAEMRQGVAKLQSVPRAALTEHYNILQRLTDMQKGSLGRDFRPDSTLTEEEQQLKIDSAVAIIAAPYDNLMAVCTQQIERVGIRLEEGTLADLDIKYGDSLKVHENDGRWLAILKYKCESTSDFDPTDPFYVSVSKAMDDYEAKRAQASSNKRSSVETAVSPYNAKASAAWTAASKTKDTEMAFKRWLLVLYYYDKAAADDPGRAQFYKKCRNSVASSSAFKNLRDEIDFYKGTMRGKAITVDGVTFTARY